MPLSLSDSSDTTSELNLLIVEDDEDDFLILKHQLKRAFGGGAKFLWVKSLREAMRAVDLDPVSLILLDLGLPGSNAGSSFRPLAAKAGPRIPIIILTGLNNPDTISSLLAAGAQDYLIKDEVNPQLLEKSIRYAIERSKATQEIESLANSLASTESELLQAAKLEAVGRLAAGLVHQLKNPLGTVMFGINYLSTTLKPEGTTAEVLERMGTSVERADEIVSDLLDFSSAAEYNPETTDISELLASTVEMVDHRFQNAGFPVALQISKPDEPIEISVDSRKMKHLLVNLIENSLDATESIGDLESGSVSLECKLIEGNLLLLEVVDNGPHVRDEVLARATEPFFTTKSQLGGVGLGLSVADRIARLHGGELRLRREDGLTRASLRIPTGLTHS
ncbi:MAG: hybrid sensor histidine kinase/response regulator [Verrucomicrobiota bacterium]